MGISDPGGAAPAASEAAARGRAQARRVIEGRDEELAARQGGARSLTETAPTVDSPAVRAAAAGVPVETIERLGGRAPGGVIVAEGDSWFDYPRNDVLDLLEDRFGFEVEHVARAGDRVEDMAYSDGQLKKFVRTLEDVIRDGEVPVAILLSGGGNDIAGDELAMLLNHRGSTLPPWSEDVVRGVLDQRLRVAYEWIIGAVTHACELRLGRRVPIILHGYAAPVPDGRGFAGGWGWLPGPWLEPSFRRKGFGGDEHDAERRALMQQLMDRFNAMVGALPALPGFEHVRYVDLRGALPNGASYRDWWANELHPTQEGFVRVAGLIAEAIAAAGLAPPNA